MNQFSPGTLLKLWLAGSSHYSLLLAKTLLTDSRFQFQGVITPAPKPIGRQQILTPSPMAVWADQAKITKILLNEKIDTEAKTIITDQFSTSGCDVLLVVDFGYFIPEWLLKLPRIAPVNVHPSLLPRWRGSSPAQRVLLAGETNSAVSVIKVTMQLDAGEILTQLPLKVAPDWTSSDYYQTAFELAASQLGNVLTQLASNQLTLHPQPSDSPTAMAARLTKADSYVPWQLVCQACGWTTTDTTQMAKTPAVKTPAPTSGLLLAELKTLTAPKDQAILLERASRAFSPWPKLWTLLPTPRGWQRLILHQVQLDPATQRLNLIQVQLEGKIPSSWNEIKNNLAETESVTHHV